MRKTVRKSADQNRKTAEKRINRLDPNNNKNLPGRPLIRKRNKLVYDDGFEHRSSRELSI